MLLNLFKESVPTRVSNAVAAGTTDVNCTGVDCAGFDSVMHIACLGTLTATQVTKLVMEESDDNSTWTAVASGATSAMADADSNKMLIAVNRRIVKRYQRVTVDRGTANAVIDSVVSIPYNARKVDVTASSTVSQSVTV